MRIRTKKQLRAFKDILRIAAEHLTSEWGEPLKDVDCDEEVWDDLDGLAREAARRIRFMLRTTKLDN